MTETPTQAPAPPAYAAEHSAHAEHGTTPAHEGHDHHDGPHGYSPRKEDYLKRLRRIEGQVRGIARMVDEDVYCIDILTQVSAVTKALQAVALGLVEDHMGHCVIAAARSSDEEAAAKVQEASAAIARLLR